MADGNDALIDVEHHLMSFVDAFVIGAKKDRWKELLTRRGKNIGRNSSKLMAALDDRFCLRVEQTDYLNATSLGVFYEFRDEPRILTNRELDQHFLNFGGFRDAIFSIIPGRLAYHFFHEGWCWRCQR